MQRTVTALTAALVAVALWPVHAAGQVFGPEAAGLRPDAGFALTGRVFLGAVPPGDHPVEVRLVGNGMAIQHQLHTDGLGNFEFRGLQSGTYQLQVRAEGYEPADQIVEVNRGAEQVITTSVVLNRKERGEANGSGVVDLTEYEARYPADAVRDHAEARRLRDQGRTAEAIALVESVLEDTPDFYAARNTLGLLYQEAGRPNDARLQFLAARDLNPRSDEPLIHLGRLYLQAGEAEEAFGTADMAVQTFQAAAALLADAVRLNPQSVLGHYFLGSALYKSQRLEAAADALERARGLDAAFAPVYLMQANVYLKMERYADVVETLDAYLARNPSAPERASAQSMRAQVLRLLNNR